MLDFPQQSVEKPMTAMEQVVPQSFCDTSCDGLCSVQREALTADPLYAEAKAMVAAMDNGFDWEDIIALIKQGFIFVQQNQGLTLEEQKKQVMILLDDIVDLTEIPYLPDSFTDPIFKALVPPVVDIVANTFGTPQNIIPTISKGVPSTEIFQNFAAELRSTYADGWQWSDIGSYLQSTMSFVCSFESLTPEQQQAAVIEITDMTIDAVDIPYLPDCLVDPILKAMVPSIVSMLFKHL